MWLWRTREKYLSAMMLLQDDAQAFFRVPGQCQRPHGAETVPLVDYIKTPFGLGERPQGEGPEGVRPLGLEQETAPVEGRDPRIAEFEFVGEGQEVPFRTV